MSWVRPPTAQVRKLKRYRREVKREFHRGLKLAVGLVVSGAKRRTFPASKISRQDAPGGRARTLAKRTPVRSRIAKGEGTIRVLGHWTAARTPAIRSLFSKHGLDRQRIRRGLFVKNSLRRFNFTQHPKLRDWAKDHGQLYRHVVRIRDRRVLGELALLPAFDEALPEVRKVYEAAMILAARKAKL